MAIAAYEKTPENVKADITIAIGDLYLRTGEYDKGKEWLYKVIDSPKLGGYRYKQGYRDRSVAAVLLAHGAAQAGRAADVEEVMGRMPKDDLMDQAPAWYWNSKRGTCRLRTLLRFYEVMALKQAGDPEGARQKLELYSFSSGTVRMGEDVVPMEQAVQRLK